MEQQTAVCGEPAPNFQFPKTAEKKEGHQEQQQEDDKENGGGSEDVLKEKYEVQEEDKADFQQMKAFWESGAQEVAKQDQDVAKDEGLGKVGQTEGIEPQKLPWQTDEKEGGVEEHQKENSGNVFSSDDEDNAEEESGSGNREEEKVQSHTHEETEEVDRQQKKSDTVSSSDDDNNDDDDHKEQVDAEEQDGLRVQMVHSDACEVADGVGRLQETSDRVLSSDDEDGIPVQVEEVKGEEDGQEVGEPEAHPQKMLDDASLGDGENNEKVGEMDEEVLKKEVAQVETAQIFGGSESMSSDERMEDRHGTDQERDVVRKEVWQGNDVAQGDLSCEDEGVSGERKDPKAVQDGKDCLAWGAGEQVEEGHQEKEEDGPEAQRKMAPSKANAVEDEEDLLQKSNERETAPDGWSMEQGMNQTQPASAVQGTSVWEEVGTQETQAQGERDWAPFDVEGDTKQVTRTQSDAEESIELRNKGEADLASWTAEDGAGNEDELTGGAVRAEPQVLGSKANEEQWGFLNVAEEPKQRQEARHNIADDIFGTDEKVERNSREIEGKRDFEQTRNFWESGAQEGQHEEDPEVVKLALDVVKDEVSESVSSDERMEDRHGTDQQRDVVRKEVWQGNDVAQGDLSCEDEGVSGKRKDPKAVQDGKDCLAWGAGEQVEEGHQGHALPHDQTGVETGIVGTEGEGLLQDGLIHLQDVEEEVVASRDSTSSSEQDEHTTDDEERMAVMREEYQGKGDTKEGMLKLNEGATGTESGAVGGQKSQTHFDPWATTHDVVVVPDRTSEGPQKAAAHETLEADAETSDNDKMFLEQLTAIPEKKGEEEGKPCELAPPILPVEKGNERVLGEVEPKEGHSGSDGEVHEWGGMKAGSKQGKEEEDSEPVSSDDKDSADSERRLDAAAANDVKNADVESETSTDRVEQAAEEKTEEDMIFAKDTTQPVKVTTDQHRNEGLPWEDEEGQEKVGTEKDAGEGLFVTQEHMKQTTATQQAVLDQEEDQDRQQILDQGRPLEPLVNEEGEVQQQIASSRHSISSSESDEERVVSVKGEDEDMEDVGVVRVGTPKGPQKAAAHETLEADAETSDNDKMFLEQLTAIPEKKGEEEGKPCELAPPILPVEKGNERVLGEVEPKEGHSGSDGEVHEWGGMKAGSKQGKEEEDSEPVSSDDKDSTDSERRLDAAAANDVKNADVESETSTDRVEQAAEEKTEEDMIFAKDTTQPVKVTTDQHRNEGLPWEDEEGQEKVGTEKDAGEGLFVTQEHMKQTTATQQAVLDQEEDQDRQQILDQGRPLEPLVNEEGEVQQQIASSRHSISSSESDEERVVSVKGEDEDMEDVGVVRVGTPKGPQKAAAHETLEADAETSDNDKMFLEQLTAIPEKKGEEEGKPCELAPPILPVEKGNERVLGEVEPKEGHSGSDGEVHEWGGMKAGSKQGKEEEDSEPVSSDDKDSTDSERRLDAAAANDVKNADVESETSTDRVEQAAEEKTEEDMIFAKDTTQPVKVTTDQHRNEGLPWEDEEGQEKVGTEKDAGEGLFVTQEHMKQTTATQQAVLDQEEDQDRQQILDQGRPLEPLVNEEGEVQQQIASSRHSISSSESDEERVVSVKGEDEDVEEGVARYKQAQDVQKTETLLDSHALAHDTGVHEVAQVTALTRQSIGTELLFHEEDPSVKKDSDWDNNGMDGFQAKEVYPGGAGEDHELEGEREGSKQGKEEEDSETMFSDDEDSTDGERRLDATATDEVNHVFETSHSHVEKASEEGTEKDMVFAKDPNKRGGDTTDRHTNEGVPG